VELIVRIGSDPTSWVVPDSSYESVAAQLGQATGPLELPVTAPLGGRLVLSPRAAGSVALIQPSGGVWQTHDWNPGHDAAPTAPLVYLASPAGAGQSAVYAVSSNVNAMTVAQDIKTAMTDKTAVTFQVHDTTGAGLLVIDGATLPFAVVC
jgi:hypothetical protein